MKKKLIIMAMFILLMLAVIPTAMAECSSHRWMTEGYTAATCTSDGRLVQRCMTCGKSNTTTYTKLGHKTTTSTTKATCSKAGKTVTSCTRSGCNYTVVKTIPKEEHKYSKWTTKKAPTCSSTGIEKRTCSVCKYEDNRPISYKDPGNHSNLGSSVTTKDPTCTEAGSGYRLCKACGVKVSVTIAKKGHTYGNWTTKKAPTCSSTGIEKRVCSVCQAEDNRPITYKDPGNHSNLGNVVPVKDSTCTELGSGYRLCSACGEKVSMTIAKKAHTYGDWATKKASTCSSMGLEKRVCSVCQAEDNRPITYLDPGNHSALSDWTITKEPSCAETGLKYAVCSACKETVTTTIPKSSVHSYGKWTTKQAPTCSGFGMEHRICSVCQEEDNRPITYLDPSNHSALTQWTTHQPTNTAEGYKYRKCIACGKEERVTIPSLGCSHVRDYNYGPIKCIDPNPTHRKLNNYEKEKYCEVWGIAVCHCTICTAEIQDSILFREHNLVPESPDEDLSPLCKTTKSVNVKCEKCGYRTLSIIEPVGCNEDGFWIEADNCLEPDIKHYFCTRCLTWGRTEVIAPALESHVSPVTVEDPASAEYPHGCLTTYCKTCKIIIKQTAKECPMKPTIRVTCDTEGDVLFTCTCGKSETRYISSQSHNCVDVNSKLTVNGVHYEWDKMCIKCGKSMMIPDYFYPDYYLYP